jgi:D-3-phosphoglycerate dehydrogenase / 2-oxoglutarate reductase
MNILISDPCEKEAIDYLKSQGLSIIYKPDIKAKDLGNEVRDIGGWMVRSRTLVTADLIKKAPNLKVVGRIGSGYDNIDVDYCRSKNITVVNAPDANSEAVAELTVALIISLLRQLPRAYKSMDKGEWLKDDLWGHELSGLTVGIVGHGYVGTKVEKIVSTIGANVQVFSRRLKTCTLEDLFTSSDIISLHISLTPETKGLIGLRLLNLMKPTAYIINISRGKVVDEDALFTVLKNNKIAGAALDVFHDEPLPVLSRWRNLPNVIITPHIGAATREALKKASVTVAEDIFRVLKNGKAKFQV